ncbi:MAG: FIST C-terminal domain-containing protein, partial [Actinomycetota bacterium]|nr:FIST C-terminal domain-containing protein [Actinomycetota bacterium]
ALPAIVTRSDGRRILALDGRPAEEVYLEAIGHPRRGLSDSEFERLAALHPVAQLELGGRVRPRHVRGRSPGGGLRCATAIPENATVAFGEQSRHGILSSARAASQDALAPLRGGARAALVFDCAARRSVLGIDPQAEVDVLTSVPGSNRPLVGLYTRGEVARTRGASGDLNHAVVIVAFA